MAYHEVNDGGHRKFMNDQEYNEWRFDNCIVKLLTVVFVIGLPFYAIDQCTSQDSKSEEKQKTEQINTPTNAVSKPVKRTKRKKSTKRNRKSRKKRTKQSSLQNITHDKGFPALVITPEMFFNK